MQGKLWTSSWIVHSDGEISSDALRSTRTRRTCHQQKARTQSNSCFWLHLLSPAGKLEGTRDSLILFTDSSQLARTMKRHKTAEVTEAQIHPLKSEALMHDDHWIVHVK